jgi:serine phosphatase RsbU (regulator of sigma subunit)
MVDEHGFEPSASSNKPFCENATDGVVATLFFTESDDSSGRLRYANCGHLSALLLRSNESLEQLHSTDTVLGLFREWDCSMEERRLFAGDTFVLYTERDNRIVQRRGEEWF